MFLLLPLLAILVVLAHLVNSRRTVVTVPSVIPWKALRNRAAPGTRRRWSLSARLILQVLILAAAILAASGPRWSCAGPRGDSLLILFDRSASMNAPSPGGGTRLQSAKDALVEWIDRQGPGNRIILRCFPPLPGGDTSAPAQEAGRHIEAIPPSDGPGDLVAMLESVPAGRRGGPNVLAVSDGAGSEVDDPGDTRLLLVGGPLDNLGIEAFSVDLSRTPEKLTAFVRIGNGGAGPRTAEVEALRGGRLVAGPLEVSIEGGAERGVTLSFEEVRPPAGEVLEVRLRTEDAFRADDRVFAVPSRRERTSLTLVGADAPYLERFIESDPYLALTPAGEVDRKAGGRPGKVLYYRTVPATPDGVVPAIVVDPSTEYWNTSVRHLEGDLRISCRGLPDSIGEGMESLRFGRLTVLDPAPAGAEVFALAQGMPVVAKLGAPHLPPHWFVGLPVDESGSNWVLKPWFPIFWSFLLDLVAGSGGSGTGQPGTYEFYKTGSWITFAPPGKGAGTLTGPTGEKPHIRTSGERIVFRGSRAGLYAFGLPTGGPGRTFAVNILDSRETNLEGREARPADLPPPSRESRVEGSVSLKEVAVAVGFVLLMILSLVEFPRRKLVLSATLL
ncbi:MAG: vWA domain-containing protein, partial [Planctomycetota bacterium]